METTKEIIQDIAKGHQPDQKIQSELLGRIQDQLDVKRIEIANKLYSKPVKK